MTIILLILCVSAVVAGFGYALLVVGKRADEDLDRMSAWDRDNDDIW